MLEALPELATHLLADFSNLQKELLQVLESQDWQQKSAQTIERRILEKIKGLGSWPQWAKNDIFVHLFLTLIFKMVTSCLIIVK